MKTTLLVAMLGMALVGPVVAQDPNVNNRPVVNVSSDISVSTTWTKENVYNLQQQIYVLPGATLTIEEGTVVASTTGVGGSLAVTRGAQIFVQGTRANPVIMTSTDDVATWVNGDPKTGTWREGVNEWGNLTIMGSAYISEDATPTNNASPTPSNVATMEGLTAQFPGDTRVLYGGGNDDDDSGSIRFLSIRYGGRVIGLNNELNGLSLGGIGRGTEIEYVEIMNNVDDGIEIWGGTFNLSHFAIWNVGDDSLDIDQGYRGKIQFGLIVQGYSVDASQGSGVGDNCIETDGAEDSDWQPVTTTTMYNLTVVGNPGEGDGLTAWRDNANVQYRNCIFMDGGERVVRFDGDDGDGASGYGHNGTLGWSTRWTTSAALTSTVNAPSNPAFFYQTQVDGNLIEMSDSIFYNNLASDAYTEFNARGANNAAFNNVIEPANSPVTNVTRGAPVVKGGKIVVPLTFIDPTPANDALTSVGSAPADGFFTAANYRGAFAPGRNWLTGWSAGSAFGFTAGPGYPTANYNSRTVGTVDLVAENLAPGAETYHLVTLNDPAPFGPGTGNFIFGLQASNVFTFASLLDQFGTPSFPGNPFHFPAPVLPTATVDQPIFAGGLASGLVLEGVCAQVGVGTSGFEVWVGDVVRVTVR